MPPTTGTTQDNAPSGARRFRRGRHVWPRHLRDLGVYLDDHGRRHVLTSEEQKRGEWVDSRANRRTEPRDEFHDDDGTVVYGDAAIRAGIERWAPELAATLPPLPTTPPLPPRAPQSIGAPRRTVQSSGRPRASATRPGAASGDSGDSDLSDEPPASARPAPTHSSARCCSACSAVLLLADGRDTCATRSCARWGQSA